MSVPVCPHPSWIEVDLRQFKKNIATIRRHIGRARYCLPVKANAYGHGLCALGCAAEEAGIDYLAVAHLQEGVQLRLAGVRIPILVLGAIHAEQIPDLLTFQLEFTISSLYKAQLVANVCTQLHKQCRVHMEVDTGMQRTGVRPETARGLFAFLREQPCFEIVGVYSHLSHAQGPEDPVTERQIATFCSLLQGPLFCQVPLIRHLANSGGTAYFPAAHLDMVRPSLLTLGYFSGPIPAELEEVAPCFAVKSKVAYFKVVEGGVGIGYGHTHTTAEQTRIVTVPIGYGDGYRRALSNLGEVLIRGKRFPIVGRVCMDQLMVSVGRHEVYVGDEVVLVGRQHAEEISVQQLAQQCGTIPNEVLCFFNDRLPRLYIR